MTCTIHLQESGNGVPSFIFNQNLRFWNSKNGPINPVPSSKCVPTHAFYPNPPFFGQKISAKLCTSVQI